VRTKPSAAEIAAATAAAAAVAASNKATNKDCSLCNTNTKKSVQLPEVQCCYDTRTHAET